MTRLLFVQVGAVLCYTPEHGINLDVLQEDVDFLKKRYALDVPGKSEGRLVIRRVSTIGFQDLCISS